MWILTEARREIKVLCVEEMRHGYEVGFFIKDIDLNRLVPSCVLNDNEHSSFSLWVISSFIRC